MKKTFLFAAVVFASLTGCSSNETSKVKDGDKELTVSSTKDVSIPAGGAATVTVSVVRKGFDADVTVAFDDLPAGVTVVEKDPIAKGTNEAKFTLKAAEDAKIVSGQGAKITAKSDKFSAKHHLSVAVTEKKSGESDIEKNKAKLQTWYDGQVKEINNAISNLQTKGKDLKDDAKVKIDADIKELQKQRDDFAKDFAKIKDKTADSWSEFDKGVRKSWDELSDAAKKAADKWK